VEADAQKRQKTARNLETELANIKCACILCETFDCLHSLCRINIVLMTFLFVLV